MINVPVPEDVLSKLSPLFTTLYASLEDALQKTKEYFDGLDRETDRYLAPNFVRYHAKWNLAQEGRQVEEEEAQDYELQHLPSNGLSLTCGGYQIRILKSDDGELPVPGPSKRRQEFWNQLSINFGDDPTSSSESSFLPALNLVVLWDVDASYHLKTLKLSCPKSGSTTKDSVSDYWTVVIPHPVESLSVVTMSQSNTDEGDLEMSLKKSADTGTKDSK